MADEEKKTGGGNGASADPDEGRLPPEPSGQDREPEEEDSPEERQKITLDRYLSSRKRTHTGWGQLMVLLFMLLTLVLLLMYKDRCGDSVSGFLFMGTPDAGAPAVRIKLDPQRSPPPASRPTP